MINFSVHLLLNLYLYLNYILNHKEKVRFYIFGRFFYKIGKNNYPATNKTVA